MPNGLLVVVVDRERYAPIVPKVKTKNLSILPVFDGISSGCLYIKEESFNQVTVWMRQQEPENNYQRFP